MTARAALSMLPAGPSLTVIAGPTGSGKSALALALAERTSAEIVSADSQAVYRRFEVGTAKPGAADLARVPHHLVSILEPMESFSAARFQALADEAIGQVASRGHRVLVVGGTGLYLRALLHGLLDAPPDRRVRASLEDEARQTGAEALHRRLAAVDPAAARRLPVADVRRVIRALEIHATSGRPASEAFRAHGFRTARYPFVLWVLDPPRDALARAIERRTRGMFKGGLLEEVRGLLEDGYREAPALQSVGYRQALAVVEGRMGFEEALAEAGRETRRFAKRQTTWFRKEPGARFLLPPYAELAGADGG